MMLRYAITDPAYYSDDPALFRGRLVEVLRVHSPHLICLRDKTTPHYASLARPFTALKAVFQTTRFLLHGDVALAASLGADGIHLPSRAIDRVPSAKEAGLFCIVSTHTLEEALRCEALGADAITFSPIFDSPGKGDPQGLEKLKEIRDKISIKIIALGGIVTPDQIEAVARAGADGFASIRYFAP